VPTPGYIAGPLVIPLTFQLRLIWQLANGKVATNVLHAIVADGTDPSVAMANTILGNLVADAATDTYLAFLTTTTALQFIDIRDIRTPAQAAFQSTGPAAPGTGVLHALPEEVALVCTLRTALAGRAHRGRVYLSGFDASGLTAEGHATPGLTAAAQAFVEQLALYMAGEGLALGVGHRGHAEYVNAVGNTVAAEAAGTDLVTQVVVRDNVFDSQRRRK
jgi:hypothetical protein